MATVEILPERLDRDALGLLGELGLGELARPR